MGITSHLESGQQVCADPGRQELLERLDKHLTNIKHSLAAARKSVDTMHGVVNRREHENKTQTCDPSIALRSVHNKNMKPTNGKVTKVRPEIRSQDNMARNLKEWSQHGSALTSVATNATTRVTPKARRIVSSNVDVSYNASNPALRQDSESNVDQTLPGEAGVEDTLPEQTGVEDTLPEQAGVEGTLPEQAGVADTLPEQAGVDDILPEAADIDYTLPEQAGLDQANEGTPVLPDAPEDTLNADAESVKKIINSDLLPTPSIMITSATPYEQEPEDTVEAEVEEIVEVEKTISVAKSLSKQVSFDETANEEVIIPESATVRRSSLDDSVLLIAEKRKLDEESKRLSMKRTQSSDVVKSASKVLEELQKAAEGEQVARVDAKEDAVLTSSRKSSDRNVLAQDSMQAIERRSRGRKESDLDHTGISETATSAEQSSHSVTDEALAQPKSLTQVLRSIDKVIYKDGVAMMWKKVEYSDEEVLVPVPPNSIFSERTKGSQSSSSVEKEKPKKPSREPCDVLLKRMLGPAGYRHMFKKVRVPEVKRKIPGADWARQLKTQHFSARPPVLYYDQWKTNKLKQHYLGPGSYEIKDFIQLGNAKPRSERGICDKLAPRFDKMTHSFTPGPGAYGIGGIPHQALEDHANRSASTRGMLDSGNRSRDIFVQGSYLAPGTYKCKSFLDELLNKVTGLKGPYELFTGKRADPIKAGFLAAPKRTKVGPGTYPFKSFVEELNTSRYNLRGRFRRQAQYPEVPTDRFSLFSGTAPCLDINMPGPADYDVKDLPRYKAVNTPGFLSSETRDNKIAQRNFGMTCHPVGPGRYAPEKWEEPRDNGHTNVFKSKTGKPNLKMARFYEERLKCKQRNDGYGACYPEKTNRSIIGM
ncbi:hypothetical protein BsWGS_03182 [Bradybaena similaris]